LLADPSIDAVVVVTRRSATGPVVADALRARKHVLSEKPMAHTSVQGEALAKEARSAGRRYAIGYMKRHDGGVEAAKKLSLELGPLISARAYGFGGDVEAPKAGWVMTDEPRPEGIVLWPTAPEWLPQQFWNAHDAFLNVHSHLVNLVRHFLPANAGELRVAGANIGDPSRSSIRAQLPAGAAIDFALSNETRGPWREGVDLQFERGSLSIALPAPFKADAYARVTFENERGQRVIPPVTEVWAFRRQAAAFVEDVAEGRVPRASGEDAVADLRFVEDAWRCSLRALPA
jgi:predicted dehydrogenase